MLETLIKGAQARAHYLREISDDGCLLKCLNQLGHEIELYYFDKDSHFQIYAGGITWFYNNLGEALEAFLIALQGDNAARSLSEFNARREEEALSRLTNPPTSAESV